MPPCLAWTVAKASESLDVPAILWRIISRGALLEIHTLLFL